MIMDEARCQRKLQLQKLEKIPNDAYENSRIYKDKTKTFHDHAISRKIFIVGQNVLLFHSKLKLFLAKDVKERSFLGGNPSSPPASTPSSANASSPRSPSQPLRRSHPENSPEPVAPPEMSDNKRTKVGESSSQYRSCNSRAAAVLPSRDILFLSL
ncbi:UNVERIFIED_CONTAM: hypothetical protein Slati_0937100 [Sesamum latifolium]|uniref:Uncharacterized protein n=1 Tax=Sesamum latifolium TaxID=2727402 RepID=A0AAW2XPZ9_9LAMI